MSLPKIAIVAAMPGEIRPLVEGWAKAHASAHGQRFRVFQQGRGFATYGAMGAGPIAAAARAILEHAHPDVLISAGWAGSLSSEIKVGGLVVPEVVIDAREGRAFRSFCGAGTLLTTTGVLDAAEKAQAAARYGAQAIDMEAAAVAEVAQETATKFLAVKAIFDEHDFAMPPLARFVGARGNFRYANFLAWIALRPRHWRSLPAMQRNSSSSARVLCRFLEKLLACDSLVEVQQQVARLALGVAL